MGSGARREGRERAIKEGEGAATRSDSGGSLESPGAFRPFLAPPADTSPLPRAAPFVDGLPGAELAVFPTIRPAPEPLSVSTCLRSGRDGQGRPVAIRLNMVPQYAELAHYNNSLDAARDAVLQQLFLAIGWSSDYHPRLVRPAVPPCPD